VSAEEFVKRAGIEPDPLLGAARLIGDLAPHGAFYDERLWPSIKWLVGLAQQYRAEIVRLRTDIDDVAQGRPVTARGYGHRQILQEVLDGTYERTPQAGT
jgi:hypothetical protein